MRFRLLIAVVGSVALLSACTSDDGTTPVTPTASPLKPAPDVHLNVSARDATRDGGMIMQAGLAGTLRVDPRGCLYAYIPRSPRSGGRDFRTDLVWPRGTTVALNDSGTPVVVRYDDVVVAEVGHSLRGLGGGNLAARHRADITCRVHQKGSMFYIQGDMPPLSDGE